MSFTVRRQASAGGERVRWRDWVMPLVHWAVTMCAWGSRRGLVAHTTLHEAMPKGDQVVQRYCMQGSAPA